MRAARGHGLAVFQPADPHAPEFLGELRTLRPEVLCVASYGVILKPALLELCPQGALNVHGSLLPRWRGASPIQAAVLAGDALTGVSIQRIVLALDEGDVLLAKERTIGPRETSGDLFASLAVLGGEALVEALDRLEDGNATFTPQDPTRATYARKIRKERGAIDWSKPAVEIERAVRAFNPWPLARLRDPKGRELNVLAAQVVERNESAEPGTVLEADERFVVACGSGALELLEVQVAGKRAMHTAEFLRGARMSKGEKVGTPPTNPK